MKIRTIRALGLTALLALSGLALNAIPPGWVYVGCWSPYPNCVGAKDVYQDSTGAYWQCSACGTTTNPSPTTCYRSNIGHIGYWCGVSS
jgi:hypothetical protein